MGREANLGIVAVLLAAVALTVVLFWNSSSMPAGCIAASSDRTTITQQPHAANSATGRIFAGKKSRTFNEALIHQEATPPATRTVATPPDSSLLHCESWAVVTSIFKPSDSVRRAGKLDGWCLVVVGDKKTPTDYLKAMEMDLTEIVFLSAEDQEILAKDDDFVANTPWNHFARKNIGFLYAIRHGARFIFDFDDDNSLFIDVDGRFNRFSPCLSHVNCFRCPLAYRMSTVCTCCPSQHLPSAILDLLYDRQNSFSSVWRERRAAKGYHGASTQRVEPVPAYGLRGETQLVVVVVVVVVAI